MALPNGTVVMAHFIILVTMVNFITNLLVPLIVFSLMPDIPKKPESETGAPFNTLLGVTDGGVEVYSCDYSTVDKDRWTDMSWFVSTVNGVYTGFKWQCVELARRYLLINYNCVFDDIQMAYDIFRLKSVRRVSDNQLFVMNSHLNGNIHQKSHEKKASENADDLAGLMDQISKGPVLPQKGSLLMWRPKGYFGKTGHVAVIINVAEDYVDIVEQNVDDEIWPKGRNYSRRLSMKKTLQDGVAVKVTLNCTFNDTEILGWTTVDFSKPYTYQDLSNCQATDLERHEISIPKEKMAMKWMPEDKDYQRIFVQKEGHGLSSDSTAPYYTITEKGHAGLEAATNELHALFLDATDYVVNRPEEFGPLFCIPKQLWPKLRKSWFRKRQDVIAGRFDFTLAKDGIKVYEYNADSASCLLECGEIQGRWAEKAGLGNVGRDAGAQLFSRLVNSWKKVEVKGPLHIMCDVDLEEQYHANYMRAAAEEANISPVKVVVGGASGFSWDANDGSIIDADGLKVENVWKSWSWRTALNQLTDEDLINFLEKEDLYEDARLKRDYSTPPRLVDVLLHINIRIFEPLWTLIPSSKAILPVLWKLKPNHPFLIKSSFDLTPELQKSGYVTKPVTGRAGGNISIFKSDGNLLEETLGRWSDDRSVYQELSMLPKYGEDYVQVCTWAVSGAYGGSVLRVDQKHIINYESRVNALRIIPN